MINEVVAEHLAPGEQRQTANPQASSTTSLQPNQSSLQPTGASNAAASGINSQAALSGAGQSLQVSSTGARITQPMAQTTSPILPSLLGIGLLGGVAVVVSVFYLQRSFVIAKSLAQQYSLLMLSGKL